MAQQRVFTQGPAVLGAAAPVTVRAQPRHQSAAPVVAQHHVETFEHHPLGLAATAAGGQRGTAVFGFKQGGSAGLEKRRVVPQGLVRQRLLHHGGQQAGPRGMPQGSECLQAALAAALLPLHKVTRLFTLAGELGRLIQPLSG
ncbi:hypothetical protein D9M68_822070 [compost metagenome]